MVCFLGLGWRLTVLGLRRYQQATAKGNKNFYTKETSSSEVKVSLLLLEEPLLSAFMPFYSLATGMRVCYC